MSDIIMWTGVFAAIWITTWTFILVALYRLGRTWLIAKGRW
jgi:hypothetical protein